MKPVAILLMLAMSFLSLAATETPLVMNGGGVTAVIEPGVGIITLYAVEGQQLTRYGSTNFLTDLYRYRDMPIGEVEKNTISALRAGCPNFTPTPSDILGILPAKPTAEEKAAGLECYKNRALLAENEFWKALPEYDGVVRAAMGSNVIMLVIPSLHSLLVYELQDRNRGPQLVSWRNVGPDLLIPSGLDSSPALQTLLDAIIQALPPERQVEMRKILNERFKKAAEKEGALTLQTPDMWMCFCSGNPGRFVLLDTANMRLVTYEWNGGKVKMVGARNMDIDLMVPTAFSSLPATTSASLNEFTGKYKKLLQDQGFLPLNEEILTALVSQSTKTNAAKINPVQASVSGGDVILDFIERRKMLVYRAMGIGNKLELVSVRDYTVDVGLALLADKLSAPTRGADAIANADGLLGKRQNDMAMRMLQYALKQWPALVAQIEKSSRYKDLKKHSEWDAMIDDGKKRAAEEETKRQERIKLAQEMKDKRTR